MSSSDSVSGQSSRMGAVSSEGPARLPPPVRPVESVLRSIAALDAIEDNPSAKPSAPRARPAPVIEAVANEPSQRSGPADEPGGNARAAKRPAEPVQPLRANAFRPNAAQSAPVRSRSTAWMMRAAAVMAVLGGGWLGVSALVNGQSPFSLFHGETSAQLSPVEMMRQELRQLSGDMAALRHQLAQIDSPEIRSRQIAEADAVKKSLADLTRRIEQGRTAQTASVSELGARLERARQEDIKQREEVTERLARLERHFSDGRPTGAVSAAPPPQNTIVPRAGFVPPPPQEASAQRKPSPLTGYVLREVYNGVALIEGRNGFVEAYPGTMLPGAGRVQSIARRGGSWVVVTSNGVIGPQAD